jgi:cell division protease FtsH
LEALLNRINPWIIVLLLVVAVGLLNFSTTGTNRSAIPYNTFLELVNANKIDNVSFTEEIVDITLKQPERVATTNGGEKVSAKFQTQLPTSSTPDTALITTLNQKGVTYAFRTPSNWLPLLINFLPFLLFLGFFYFIMMRSSGGQGQVMQFGQSRAKQYGRERKVNTTFSDVAGHEEVKKELVEVVDFLKNPGKYHAIGAEIPKGVLLVGPPGTGKTLLARAIAGEAGVPFFTVSASEFMEMFVGVGASRVRSLFEDARKASPAIIFIDELDSIGRKRGAGIGGGHDEREQTLNQILTEMDGFDKSTSVIVMAATNRPDILDHALLRPGRFDRQVTVGLPTLKEREAIMNVHLKNKPVEPGVDVLGLAKMTPGMSGADLKNLANEAALEAARLGKTAIGDPDFSRAFDKITLGLERPSLVLTAEFKRMTAYHEAGHAVVAQVLEHAMKPSKVSIVPRGRTGGVTMFIPTEETESLDISKEQAEARLAMAFGGRAAEEEFIGTIGAGAAGDFQMNINLARRMVLEWGMGDRFRNIAWGGSSGPVFLGEQLVNRSEVSEETARLIDEDIRDILERNYTRTKKILGEYAQAMHDVASALLEHEIINGDVVREAVERVKRTIEVNLSPNAINPNPAD